MFCLRVPTGPEWARAAALDLDAVLVDHAHCEMKAASNAMSLVVRHPGDMHLVRELAELAREEMDHFVRVVAILAERGLVLGPPPVDTYAAELRRRVAEVSRAASLPVIVDRLLVGALIEARSCERFKLLLAALPDDAPADMRALYTELFAAEARHYRAYVELAVRVAGESRRAEVEARLEVVAEQEGKVVEALARTEVRATIHG
jgi:tRNA 2-(methylsulfanyl)-N6-isopentenyladenosine37 hydroxylase